MTRNCRLLAERKPEKILAALVVVVAEARWLSVEQLSDDELVKFWRDCSEMLECLRLEGEKRASAWRNDTLKTIVPHLPTA